MTAITTSIPKELYIEAQTKGIGWSKALKLGIEMCLAHGVDTLDKLKTNIDQLNKAVELKQIHIDELKRSNTDLKARLIKKSIQLTMPDLHEKFSNKINPGFDIEEIRAATGEKWGMMDLAEAYDFVDLLDYKGVPE